MKWKLMVSLLFLLLFFSSPYLTYAETLEGEERKSKQYDENRYELMTYAEDSWWDVAGKTGSSVATSIKSFIWMVNIVVANIVLMIVYQLFSLDIIEMTKGAVEEITSSTASTLTYNFGLFALAVASFGIVIRAYIQQNWQAFFKLLSLIMLSLTLLFSIQTEKFNYIDFAHGFSTTLENALMEVNPSLTEDESFNFDSFNENSARSVSVSVENKVFDALIYQPYLLLQYGSADEAKINDEKSGRIKEYLEADPSTKDGMNQREKIAKDEYTDYNNKQIFAGNAFKQAGYIMVMLLSTIIQGIVFFFIALVRIMLQFAFILMMLLAPFILFISIFPSFEALVARYTKGTFILVFFKAITMFFILVATSFITLGYDMTNMSNDLYYRIFIQIVFSVAIIFMYMKRQFVFSMLEGASPSLNDMGAERTGRTALSRTQKGFRNVSHFNGKTGIKKPGPPFAHSRRKAGDGIAMIGQSARNVSGSIHEKVKSARSRIGQAQQGEPQSTGMAHQGINKEVAALTDHIDRHSYQDVNMQSKKVAVLSKNPATPTSTRNPIKPKIKHNSTNTEQTSNNKKTSTQNIGESSQTLTNPNKRTARNPYYHTKDEALKNNQNNNSSSRSKTERRLGGSREGLLHQKSHFHSSKDE
ncbi:CD3337/EF1877 family mobilome membrane protein [Pseudalkalibacillus sp. R45]|uniref:CD3337/EF1877 family mobilome membrane protein n=1 Tax=Pseudalkalibacillus sp. R45 TaxID=3457433 RepID=UPI003FCDCB81